jgi:hypothetical protein
MLSQKRDEAAAEAFFIKAIGTNGLPAKSPLIKVVLLKQALMLSISNSWFVH